MGETFGFLSPPGSMISQFPPESMSLKQQFPVIFAYSTDCWRLFGIFFLFDGAPESFLKYQVKEF
jgi:hypothetical protein